MVFGRGATKKVVETVQVEDVKKSVEETGDDRIQQYKNEEERLKAEIQRVKKLHEEALLEEAPPKEATPPAKTQEPVTIENMIDDGVYVLPVGFSGKMWKKLERLMVEEDFMSLDEVLRDAVRFYGAR
jgi:hypothetical protein